MSNEGGRGRPTQLLHTREMLAWRCPQGQLNPACTLPRPPCLPPLPTWVERVAAVQHLEVCARPRRDGQPDIVAAVKVLLQPQLRGAAVGALHRLAVLPGHLLRVGGVPQDHLQRYRCVCVYVGWVVMVVVGGASGGAAAWDKGGSRTQRLAGRAAAEAAQPPAEGQAGGAPCSTVPAPAPGGDAPLRANCQPPPTRLQVSPASHNVKQRAAHDWRLERQQRPRRDLRAEALGAVLRAARRRQALVQRGVAGLQGRRGAGSKGGSLYEGPAALITTKMTLHFTAWLPTSRSERNSQAAPRPHPGCPPSSPAGQRG